MPHLSIFEENCWTCFFVNNHFTSSEHSVNIPSAIIFEIQILTIKNTFIKTTIKLFIFYTGAKIKFITPKISTKTTNTICGIGIHFIIASNTTIIIVELT